MGAAERVPSLASQIGDYAVVDYVAVRRFSFRSPQPIPSPEPLVSRHFFVVVLVSLGLAGCQDFTEVLMVKGGKLQLCPAA